MLLKDKVVIISGIGPGLGVKLAVVVLSGVAAYVHSRATSRGALAAWGSISGTAAVAALVMGVFLAN